MINVIKIIDNQFQSVPQVGGSHKELGVYILEANYFGAD